jgi:hypothetical protein
LLVNSQRFSPLFVHEKLLPVDDRLALNHLLVVGPEFFGNVLRKEIEIALADGLGLGLAAEIFQVGGIGHRLSAGGVLGVDAIRQVVNECPQQQAFL